MRMYDMASVLFAGPCNARCVMCVGRRSNWPSNLNEKEMPGLASFLDKARGIECCSVSGINTDPLLYPYLDKLARVLRERFPRVTLHTNGLLLAERHNVANLFTKITVSLASFDDDVNRAVMEVSNRKILDGIRKAAVPVKLSGILTEKTSDMVKHYLENAEKMGIKQVVLRQELGKRFPVFEKMKPVRLIYGNPVYVIGGIEVTVWDYTVSTLKGLYLYPDGKIENRFLVKKLRG